MGHIFKKDYTYKNLVFSKI